MLAEPHKSRPPNIRTTLNPLGACFIPGAKAHDLRIAYPRRKLVFTTSSSLKRSRGTVLLRLGTVAPPSIARHGTRQADPSPTPRRTEMDEGPPAPAANKVGMSYAQAVKWKGTGTAKDDCQNVKALPTEVCLAFGVLPPSVFRLGTRQVHIPSKPRRTKVGKAASAPYKLAMSYARVVRGNVTDTTMNDHQNTQPLPTLPCTSSPMTVYKTPTRLPPLNLSSQILDTSRADDEETSTSPSYSIFTMSPPPFSPLALSVALTADSTPEVCSSALPFVSDASKHSILVDNKASRGTGGTLSLNTDPTANIWFYGESRAPLIGDYHPKAPTCTPRVVKPLNGNLVWRESFWLGLQATTHDALALHAERLEAARVAPRFPHWEMQKSIEELSSAFIAQVLQFYEADSAAEPIPHFVKAVVDAFKKKGGNVAFRFVLSLGNAIRRNLAPRLNQVGPAEFQEAQFQAVLNLSMFTGDLARLDVLNFDVFADAIRSLSSKLGSSVRYLQPLRHLIIRAGEAPWRRNGGKKLHRWSDMILHLADASLANATKFNPQDPATKSLPLHWLAELDEFFRTMRRAFAGGESKGTELVSKGWALPSGLREEA